MYKVRKQYRSSIQSIPTVEGETIEEKVRRIVSNKEPIKDGAPEIFTERKAGVVPAYNPRTDRWEIATDAMSLVEKSITAKRDGKVPPKIDGVEPTDGENLKAS